MNHFNIINDWGLSKVEQVAESIKREIEKGNLRKNEQLPSVNEFSVKYQVARDTIEKAYGILKRQGYIRSVPSKGYFVLGKKDKHLKVLLVLNKLSAYKKIVYTSFIETLGENAKVDLQIHHYNPSLLKEIIETNLGKYHYYVIMPHFYHDTRLRDLYNMLELIPEHELVLLDKQVKGFKRDCIEVYQDFRNDIYGALLSAQKQLQKYSSVAVILEKESHHPREIIEGAKKFCEQFGKRLQVLPGADEIKLEKGVVYIETSESDLASLIKKARHDGLKIGKEIGIISFNETVLKELLNVTVVTTDFKEMGAKAAQCILENKIEKVKNPFYMIKRKSI